MCLGNCAEDFVQYYFIIILHVCNSYCLFEHDCLATVATYGNERVNVKCQLSLVSTLPRYLLLLLLLLLLL